MTDPHDTARTLILDRARASRAQRLRPLALATATTLAVLLIQHVIL